MKIDGEIKPDYRRLPLACEVWRSKKDKNGYYLFNVGTDMSVYNLGVFVMKIPASKAGMGGVVVSKQMLEVNFARNDVDSKCEIMKHLNDVIRDNRIKKTRQRRRTLDPWERQATLTDVRDGQQDMKDVKTLSLIPTEWLEFVACLTYSINSLSVEVNPTKCEPRGLINIQPSAAK